MDLGAAEVLNALCAELTAQGTSSRELTALEFDPASGHVEIVSRKRPHAKSYPDLISTHSRILGRPAQRTELASNNFDASTSWSRRSN
jgi:hypothetical protein